MVQTIPLTQGKVALIDDEDYPAVSKFKWCLRKCRDRFYAGRGLPGNKLQYLHRFLLPEAKMVDHVDGDGLNNCRSNIRPATHAQNSANRPKYKKTASKYKGVYKYDYLTTSKWKAQSVIENKTIYLGYFTDEIDAAKAYDAFARERFGEYAQVNFPPEKEVMPPCQVRE